MTAFRMLPYYGSKASLADKYLPPVHDVIVEPFAGSAGYASMYADHKVILIDRNPVVAGIWRYLIAATPDQIMALPDVTDRVDTIVCENAGATWLPFRVLADIKGTRKRSTEAIWTNDT